MAGILKIDKNGVGEEGTEIESKVEVREEGTLGVGVFRNGVIKLVGTKCGKCGLMAAIAKSNHVDREVEDCYADFRCGHAL